MVDTDTGSASGNAIAIDPSRPAPFYRQLGEQLRSRIAAGAWGPGRAIPSERELMRSTGLSRMTVRQAVAELTHEGLLRRDHGRGTFVVSPGVAQAVRGVYSFSDGVRALGRTPSSRLLIREVVPATDEQATALALETGEPVIRLVRLRLVDDLPAMVDAAAIPLRLCPDLLTADLSGSLYALLRDDYGLPPLRSTDTLEAMAATAELSAALDIAPGSPLILMRRLALTHDDVPLELTEEYARPDRCRYRISLVAEPPTIELTSGVPRGGIDRLR